MSASETTLRTLQQEVEQLRVECEELRRHVRALEAELAQVKTERGNLLVAWSKAMVTDEELERRRNEPGGCSIAELLERLERTHPSR